MSTDVPYLRRLERRPAAGPEPLVTSSRSPGISFDRPGRQPAAQAPHVPISFDRPASQPHQRAERPPGRAGQGGAPVRRPDGVTPLTETEPLVTLSRGQSGIGCLRVAATGQLDCAWETQDGKAGLLGVGAPAPQYGRRPLLSRRGTDVVIGLRHVGHLRRVLLTLTGPAGSEVQVHLLGGSVVTARTAPPPTPEHGRGPVASLVIVYQLDGELVLRRERYWWDDVRAAAAGYGFGI